MKNYIFILIIVSLFLSKKMQSQVTPHPTIDTVKVIYKPGTQSTTSYFNVIPEASVNLKTVQNISKVYFKIYQAMSDSLLYSVQYNFDSSTITNSQGKKMFERTNQVVFISPGTTSLLKPYKYKIQTEDTLQVLSPNYVIIQ